MKRCVWVTSDVLKVYHDEVWGVPVFDDVVLFKMLCLEGQQAGLKWETILLRVDAYDEAYFNHGVDYIAQLSDDDLVGIIDDYNVIKYLLKQKSIRTNAVVFLEFFSDVSFCDYVWSFTDNEVYGLDVDLAVKQDCAMKLSCDLKQKGFKFVGPTICFSFLEAVGVFNGHCEGCFFR
jgi:DNA-3-methyladenine glycosylase I